MPNLCFAVYEMVQCAKECLNRMSASHLTFGGFCVFATELKKVSSITVTVL
jgi:hypothetical protein